LYLDDAKKVLEARQTRAAHPFGDLPDPRFVFLGGEPVYAIERALWKKYTYLKPPRAHPLIVERFGTIKSPTTGDLLDEMWGKPKAQKHALAWFEAHADYPRRELEKLAKSKSPSKEFAPKILAALR